MLRDFESKFEIERSISFPFLIPIGLHFFLRSIAAVVASFDWKMSFIHALYTKEVSPRVCLLRLVLRLCYEMHCRCKAVAHIT